MHCAFSVSWAKALQWLWHPQWQRSFAFKGMPAASLGIVTQVPDVLLFVMGALEVELGAPPLRVWADCKLGA